MTWRYLGLDVEGFPGIPAWDMTDAEFAAAEEEYDSRFEKGALRASGLYKHEATNPRTPPETAPVKDESAEEGTK